MSTIAENLQALNNVKIGIKQAIRNKGVAVADTDPFNTYPTKIGQIASGASINNQSKSVTIQQNGVTNVTFDGGYTGLQNVEVHTELDINQVYNSGFTAGRARQKEELVETAITANGTYIRENGYKKIVVNVSGGTPTPPSLENKSVSISSNGTQVVVADTGYDGLSSVTITTNVLPILQSKTITANGVYSADTGYNGLSQVVVNVSGATPVMQEKTATVNGVVLPDSGYDGLSKVTVNVPNVTTQTCTQAYYDSLPASAKTANIIYLIVG